MRDRYLGLDGACVVILTAAAITASVLGAGGREGAVGA